MTSNVSGELAEVVDDRKIKSTAAEMSRRRTLVMKRPSSADSWGFTVQVGCFELPEVAPSCSKLLEVTMTYAAHEITLSC